MEELHRAQADIARLESELRKSQSSEAACVRAALDEVGTLKVKIGQLEAELRLLTPAELVQRLQETEDALLEAMGFRPIGKRGFYLDTQGDERTSPGVDWPRSSALDFARERVMRGAK